MILATGAIERPLVFGNNDRPGIMLSSSAKEYLKIYGVLAMEKNLSYLLIMTRLMKQQLNLKKMVLIQLF